MTTRTEEDHVAWHYTYVLPNGGSLQTDNSPAILQEKGSSRLVDEAVRIIGVSTDGAVHLIKDRVQGPGYLLGAV